MKNHRVVFILLFLSCSFIGFAQNDLILVDFGNTPSPAPWNNLSNPKDGQIDQLTNSYGILTDISLTVTDSFSYINTNGTQMPNPDLGILSSASEDSFFGNAVTFSNDLQPTAAIQFSNLDIAKEYTLTIFSSRVANDNRETQYELSGLINDTAYLDVADNIDSVVVFSTFPAIDGTIEIKATTGPNNNNAFGFYYLGALKIEYPADSIPTPSINLTQPKGGEYWQVDKMVNIKWESTISDASTLEYSIDNGATWEEIAQVAALQKVYEWVVPNMPSNQCLVRISSDTLSDTSDAVFEISSDTTSCPIVVIGSSTAAGTGASTPDSAWVNRYRTAIYERDTRYPVINLAQGGYTTYHLLPTGNPLAGNVGITIDTERNITKALSFNPSGVIINLPSNDAANFFSVSDQLTNFELMVDEAVQQGVTTWVCTTQPRNFSDLTQIQIQEEARDSILSIYGNKAIDFWNGLADADGFILPEVNSGDGVHLNNDGHRILFERVYNKSLPDTLCGFLSVGVDDLKLNTELDIKVFPNPFSTSFQVRLNHEGQQFDEVEFLLFDLLGRKVYERKSVVIGSGVTSFVVEPQLLHGVTSQLFFLKVRIYDGKFFKEKVIRLFYK